MEENEKTLTETIGAFLGIAKRHAFYLLIPFISISIIASVVALKLPMAYLSKGTILIEQQQVPESMIHTTVTGFADERIRFIQQRVMTRERILSIIDKYHLYAKKRERLTPSELVEQFQDDVKVDMIAADVKSSGGAGKATIAFTIAFKSDQPATAQAVASEIVNLFLAENSRVRTQRATETTEFINEEAERVNRDIQGMENKIAEFKEKFGRSLP
ncbi:MAG: lipopolysaccharide biosynthesis protein, partial [Candidatus Methylumidiphilus sp.]